ncbi:DUF4391 domain-containing protein [Silvibacterium dinghuense]|uniref:DUF4391 domain-containing protein n=1 Tax=Silvibacterium dinghuense TaxID=1560006 RepID=A0A4V1NW30_9BACT|nr:DUF4391 domain-containing protein [Silvibacterium dinghuense]RXS97992.1 DUF4391 domain-containing protein [Silvibacterium dinghuense]GGH03636.1 hypothetical protein GCM10011586_19520 [Silvibacterium dinghuense]
MSEPSTPVDTPALPGIESVYAALELPAEAALNQRVPKKLFLEQLAAQSGTTAADKKLVREDLEEFRWLASLKPVSTGLAAYADDIREYTEIAVLAIVTRAENQFASRIERLAQLIHRAVPYPVLLFIETPNSLTFSLAHKRKPLNVEAGKPVLEEMRSVCLRGESASSRLVADLLRQLGLTGLTLPVRDMFHAYGGWMNLLVAFDSALWLQRLGSYTELRPLDSPDQADRHRAAQAELDGLAREEATLRSRVAVERQLARRVEWNLALKHLLARRTELLSVLLA